MTIQAVVGGVSVACAAAAAGADRITAAAVFDRTGRPAGTTVVGVQASRRKSRE